LFSGARAVFEQCQPQIKCLGQVDYVGENIGAASAFDLARLCISYGAIVGAVHGAHLCESEQLSVELFTSLFADSPYMWVARNIQNDAFAIPQATVKVWDDALQGIRRQAQNAGINSEFPDFVSGLFERAIKAGYGNEDAAALIKVLRSNS
jgi:3-hydroxyisobutyrate dehydrogenase-like beta-hydroxyacid dehydrogenase